MPADQIFRRRLRAAKRDPLMGLVDFWKTVQDLDLFQACVDRAVTEAEAHLCIERSVFDWLASPGGQAPSGVAPEHSLGILRALDGFVADDRVRRELERREKGRLDAPAHRTKRVSGELYWILPRSPDRLPSVAAQPRFLQCWLRSHWIVPREALGFRLGILGASRDVRVSLSGALERGRLRICLAHFEDGVTERLESRAAGYFHVDGLDSAATRLDSLERVLSAARTEDADVLVLPELTVTKELRMEVASWLRGSPGSRPGLVVAGSFHEPVGAGGFVNRTVILDALGEEALRHDKTCGIGWQRPDGSPERTEDIRQERKFDLLETPLGLLAVPICLDFGQAARPYPDLWQAIGPALVLVPSMGNDATMTMQGRRAADLWNLQRAITAVTNQPPPRADPPQTRALTLPGGTSPPLQVLTIEDEPKRDGGALWWVVDVPLK